jgi:endonuclease/exonuclease/phosphatase family metal-dependent hydrolase
MGKRAVSKFAYCNSIALTFLLAGITVAGTAASYTSPSKSVLISLIALAMPFLLLVNTTVAVYWIIRFRFWFLVPLLTIASCHSYISCIIQNPGLKEVQTVNILKIATFNVNSFGNEWIMESTKDIANYMKAHDVDIICFQEFNKGGGTFTLDSIYSAFDNWPYKVIPISPDGVSRLQLAVFSRYPIKQDMFIAYQGTPNCSMWCDLNVNGQTIRLFNNHLQTTEVSRNRQKLSKEKGLLNLAYSVKLLIHDMGYNFRLRASQAEYLHKKINESPYPTIVCGDFNSTPSSYAYHTVLGNNLRDGFRTCGHGYMYTYRYLKHFMRIDYILTSPNLKGIDYYSPDIDFHSDHNPVIMTIKL